MIFLQYDTLPITRFAYVFFPKNEECIYLFTQSCLETGTAAEGKQLVTFPGTHC